VRVGTPRTTSRIVSTLTICAVALRIAHGIAGTPADV